MTLEDRRERDDKTPDQIIPSTTDLNILSAPDSPSLLSDSTQITPMPTPQTSQSIYDNPVPSISGFTVKDLLPVPKKSYTIGKCCKHVNSMQKFLPAHLTKKRY